MSDRQEDPRDPFQLRDDPGWQLRQLLRVDVTPDGLAAVRMTFLAVVAGLMLVAVLVGLLAGRVADGNPRWATGSAALAVLVAGALALGAARLIPLRLDCADELALARSWRSRFLGRTVIGALPALVGLLGFALSGAPALYALGLAFTTPVLVLAGPFHANLVRDQHVLAQQACAVALVPALRHSVTDLTR